MKISARVVNEENKHLVEVKTGETAQAIFVPGKIEGLGSAVNGGELLFAALATCYCNDIYREARKRNLQVEKVEVEVSGEFGGVGEPARDIRYKTSVVSKGQREEVEALLRHTDSVAEIHNTLRQGCPVTLIECEIQTP